MKRSRIDLDFARVRRPVSALGIALLVIGAACATLAVAEYRAVSTESEGIDVRLAAISLNSAAPILDAAASRGADEAHDALAELATPWSMLLSELELASADSGGAVAVLAVEPDREKHQVQVLAEARTLPIALSYVERLQQSRALRFPMLQSHEVQVTDPERPVRFQILAGWSTTP